MFEGFPIGAVAGIFAAAACAVWYAGMRLADATDVLDERWRIGAALGGVILLAIATNLPEIAITASAAWSGNLDVAVGNILGGIAVQTVVLVALDAFGMRDRMPLTYSAASLVLVLEGLLVIAVLTVSIMGTQLPSSLTYDRLGPGPLLVAGIWIAGIWLIGRANRGLPWSDAQSVPQSRVTPRAYSRREKPASSVHAQSGAAAAWTFAWASGVTLAAGVVLERAGDVIAGSLNMSGVLFGATVLAAATALPELSTGLRATRKGDYQLAISDIFGGNAFLPVLFLPATLISGTAVLPHAQGSDIYLAALAVLLTCVYLTGLIFRPKRRIAGVGTDSFAVLVLYAVGIAGLFAIEFFG